MIQKPTRCWGQFARNDRRGFLYLLTILLLTFSYLTQLSQWLRWSLKHDHWSGSLIRPWCVATSNWKPVDTNVKRDLTPASTCCAEPHPWVPCQRLYSSLMESIFIKEKFFRPWFLCTRFCLRLTLGSPAPVSIWGSRRWRVSSLTWDTEESSRQVGLHCFLSMKCHSRSFGECPGQDSIGHSVTDTFSP